MKLIDGCFVKEVAAGLGNSDWTNWPFGPGFTGGFLLIITKFIFIGLVLALILGLLRWAFGPGGKLRDPEWDQENRTVQGDEALTILKTRLAKGEISLKEYEERRQALLKD